MKIKLITIDFWNTLFDSTNGAERNKYRLNALITETDKLDYFIKREELEPAMSLSWKYFNKVWKDEHRTPSSTEMVDFFWKNLRLPENPETKLNVIRKFEDSILVHPPNIIPGVKEALEYLFEKFDLAIISDTGFSPGSVLKQLLIKEDIFQYFKYFSFSNETGVAKPQKKAFETILDESHYLAAESLHIGDIERTDIVGAKLAGMNTILFEGDPTALIAKENPEQSIADAKCGDWSKIIYEIEKLNS